MTKKLSPLDEEDVDWGEVNAGDVDPFDEYDQYECDADLARYYDRMEGEL